ncbi:phage tail tape measure protein [Clostridium perfringens]
MAVVSDITIRPRMDMSEFNIAIKTMDKKLSSNMKSIQSEMSGISSSLTSASKSIVGFGVDSFNVFADFERGISRVSAIGGVVGKPLEEIKQKALDLGATTEFTSREVADAFNEMALAGWGQEDMMKGIGAALDLATISGLGFGEVTEYMLNALAPFGKTAKDAQDVVSLMTKTAKSANLDINELAKSFEYVAPLAGAMGYKMEDVNVALAILSKNGIKGSAAGTALKEVITDLNTPTEKGAAALKELGVSVKNADGSMRPLSDVLSEMSVKFQGLTDSQKASYAETITGKTGMDGFLAIMNSGPDTIDKMRDSIYDYNGAAEESANIIRNDQKGSLEDLASAYESLQLSVANTIEGAFNPIIAKVTELFQGFVNLPEPIKNIVAIIAGLFVSFSAVFAIITVGIGIFLLLTSAIGGVILSISSTILQVMAFVAALAYVWNTNEEFRNAITGIWNSLVEFFVTIGNYLIAIWQVIGPTVIGMVQALWDMLLVIINTALNVIKSYIDIFTATLQGDWRGAWSALFDIVISILGGISDFLVGIFNFILQTFGAALSGLLNAVVDTFQAILYAITHPIESAKNFFGEQIEKIKGFLNFKWSWPSIPMPHFSVSGSMNPMRWLDEGVPRIGVEWYAKGGIFSGPSIIGVGESGDEAVVPLSNRTKVRPFAQAVANELALGGSSSNGNLTINVGELVVREEADIRKIAQELYRLQQFKNRGRGF